MTTESEVWLDGTQQPPPEPAFPDPLAGLLTGEVIPGEPPAPWGLSVARPVPPPGGEQVHQTVSALFAEEPPKRKRKGRKQKAANQAAVGYRPRPARPPGKSSPAVSLITLLVTLVILFLIARAIITTITGN